MEKESDSVDYDFISKYLRDDSDESSKNQEHLSKRFETRKSGATEVFSSIGQGESYSQSSGNNSFKNFNKKYDNENNSDEEMEVHIPDEKAELEAGSSSKPVIEAKKEFLEHLKDESLSLDTASRITYDWGRK